MKLYNGDSCDVLKTIPTESIDLTVTSPPYDNLRTYDGIIWDYKVFTQIADELYRVTKWGGVIVWIVNDATINGSETGTSFRQALYFKDIGFNIHDTMIWQKDTLAFPETTRYSPCFEYMFVFSKGKPRVINILKDRKNKCEGYVCHGTSRGVDGVTFRKSNHGKSVVGEYGARYNVWQISGEKNNKTGHPAPFPVSIARDHILSWSVKGDTILDPFMGSGTTGVACKETQRDFIGIEISEKYYNIAKERIANTPYQTSLFEEVI